MRIPLRWCALEVIQYGEYSCSTDIWSLAVLLWELFNQAQVPYTGLSNEDVVTKLKKGERLARDNTPANIYEIMIRCWATEPKDRLTANDVYTEIDKRWVRFTQAPVKKSPIAPNPTSSLYF